MYINMFVMYLDNTFICMDLSTAAMRAFIIISVFTCLHILPNTKVNADNDGIIKGGVTHPCYRECVEGEAMTCVYNFTVTSFTAMSSWCGDCPNNIDACSNEGCVAAGGIVRPVTTVNRQIPGPGILVCHNDTVVVNVMNGMDSDGLTIHWHGLIQKEAAYMDGAPYLTQCPITAHDSFQYRFIADPPGTHIWHAHTGSAEADGVFGPLVVRRPLTMEPNSNYYDYDLAEHTVLIWHWLPEATATAFFNAFNTGKRMFGTGFIVNGKGGLESFTPAYQNTFDIMPREVFTVEKDKRYRFRVIFNAAPNCPVQISIDHHKLLIIASDSAAVEPVEVDSFFVNEGERYDFVLTADQEVDNYWLRIRGVGDCDSGTVQVHQEAVLRYSGAPDKLPSVSHTYEDGIRGGVLLNPVRLSTEDYPQNDIVMVIDLNNTDTEQEYDISGEPYETTYMTLALNRYSNQKVRGVYPQLNGVTFAFPSISLLTQRDSLTPDMYCTGEVVEDKYCEEDGFCSCPYILEYPSNEIIELVLVDVNSTGTDHPMHKHGRQFHVVAMGTLENISVDLVRQLNEEGKIPKKLTGAPLRDTISVPAGGYAIIRFATIDPGYWFFHCHVSHHASLGMLSVLKFGNHSEMVETPSDFPTCGDWKLPENL